MNRAAADSGLQEDCKVVEFVRIPTAAVGTLTRFRYTDDGFCNPLAAYEQLDTLAQIG